MIESYSSKHTIGNCVRYFLSSTRVGRIMPAEVSPENVSSKEQHNSAEDGQKSIIFVDTVHGSRDGARCQRCCCPYTCMYCTSFPAGPKSKEARSAQALRQEKLLRSWNLYQKRHADDLSATGLTHGVDSEKSLARIDAACPCC